MNKMKKTVTTRMPISETIIVEGRDDTTAINNAVDAMTIETHGFGIREETWVQIEKAYKENGIIVFTDPDYSGEEIRRKIMHRFPEAKQAFICRSKATKKNNVGVENAEPQDIVQALMQAKCTKNNRENIYTEEDMIVYGLMGHTDAKVRRQELGSALGIGYGNSRAFLKKLNGFQIDRDVLEEMIKGIG